MKIDIPGKTLKQITKLDLSNKNLEEFPADLFKCTNLRKLILSNNKLTHIPKQINMLRKLKVLDLSHNKISAIYANVFKLPQLTTLNVSHNLLTSIPNQLYDSSIRILIINNNLISSIDNKIISNLTKLNISNNNLSSFKISQNSSNIRQLWICNNPILTFNIDFQFTPFLKQLYTYTSEDKLHKDCDAIFKKLANKTGNSYKTFTVIKKQDNMEHSKNLNNNIFISYSHEDSQWLKLLQNNLKALRRAGENFEYWDDTKIKSSDKWKEEIDKSLQSASVAILLISTSFLASDFIQDNELPKLLEKANKNGTKIFPIILEPCLFLRFPELSKYQAVNPPDKPFTDSSVEPQKYMLKLMEEILEIVN